MTKRANWIHFIAGGKGNDHLGGTSGRDLIVGRQGDDWMHGGKGNDVLLGDDAHGGKHWGWHFGGCWNARGDGNDTLDGGPGSDLVLGGRGNDLANYTLQENLKSHDVYDGSKGFDTLKLSLTYGEARLDSIQQDIAAFRAFLEDHANPGSDHGKTFHFESFNLDARNFEALEITLVNAAPTATADAIATDEDTPLLVAAPGLLANDTDPDHLDVLGVKGADTTSALGASVSVGANGNLTYDAGDLFQHLAAGESVTDSFHYTIADLSGTTATATVQVTVNGVNDAPLAGDDVAAPEGGGGQVEERLINFDDAPNPDVPSPTVDGYLFAGFSHFGFAGAGGTGMVAASTGNNNVGGGFDADAAIKRTDGEDFALKSLAIAALSVEPHVRIEGYNNGAHVDGATAELNLNGGYATLDFGAAWSSIDEVRFFGDVDPSQGVIADYLMIDNLLVSSGTAGAAGYSEDAPLDIDVLANDSDVDTSDVLQVIGVSAKSAMGATISVNDDGTLHYDPTDADDIQALGRGETATDSFEYTVSDGHGGVDTASVSVALAGADELVSPFAGLLSGPDVNLI
jgi:VCBS repeat-containing protein